MVYESILKITHVISDSALRIAVLMPSRPAGICALAYLLEANLLYLELLLLLVGVVRHA